ncbi:MAG TPA: hypothetical protein VK927_02205 [Adhaeribacter sp.]|nr:hypothetical protein [Adhaeribacter sp.]
MIIRKLLLVFVLLATVACGDDEDEFDRIPNVLVQEQINVMDLRYPGLRNDNGYAYVPGGVKGIIVFRQNAVSYIAFERNCPYQPNTECATVSMDPSNLFFIDTCCTSQFDFGGMVTGGPARFPLKRYATTLNGNLLSITN